MQRIPEPELMTTKEQVDAYAEADFSSGDARTLCLLYTSPSPRDDT